MPGKIRALPCVNVIENSTVSASDLRMLSAEITVVDGRWTKMRLNVDMGGFLEEQKRNPRTSIVYISISILCIHA